MTTPQPRNRRHPRRSLTSRQEHFAQLIALKGLTQAEAYRQAYNAQNQSPETIYPDASTLANHNPKVIARIQELKASLTSEVVTDAAKILKELDKAGSGVATGPLRWADKVAALDKMAKLLGLYRDLEEERPRAVITNITVVLDHGGQPSAVSHQLSAGTQPVVEGEVVDQGEKGASPQAGDGS